MCSYFDHYSLDMINHPRGLGYDGGEFILQSGGGILDNFEVFLPYEALSPPYDWLVGWSVCHNFLKGREVSLPCSSRSTCFDHSPDMINHPLGLGIYFTIPCGNS